MASFEDLTRDIETKMSVEWVSTPVAYENVTFEPPSGAPWVRLTVINGSGETAGILGSQFLTRDNGLISIQVFVPEGSGTQAAKALVDGILGIYEHTRFSGIVAYSATVASIGTANGWHQTNITIPFRRVRNV